MTICSRAAVLATVALAFLSQPRRCVLANVKEVSPDEVELEEASISTCTDGEKNSKECAERIEKNEEEECSLWFAPSTIPGAGMGMFAGKNFNRNQDMTEQGDIVIPIVDISYHQEDRIEYFLWDEYTWNAAALFMENESIDVNCASPGFGSAANSVLDLVNVEENYPTQVNGSVGLHRSKDPGAGAFTYYHNRRSTATRNISAGQELFVSYGKTWFKSRERSLGALPLSGDFALANSVVKKFKRLEEKLNNTETPHRVLDALWDMFLLHKPTNQSRVLNALPNDPEELLRVKEVGVTKYRRDQATVSMEYLKANGTCASNLRVGESSIPQAGRGAFAGRNFEEGEVVSPVPLIHLVEGRRNLEMFELVKKKKDYVVRNRTEPLGQQLLMNYCFGHPESTVFLCPYGLQTGFVNHDLRNYNVKLRWGDEQKTSHDPAWLNKSLRELKVHNSAVLAFEFVAIRPIMEGEEILLNYGADWEEAWKTHVKNWKAPENSTTYKSSREYNMDKTSPLKTTFDELEEAYPDSVEMRCNSIFFESKMWKRVLAKGRDLNAYVENSSDNERVSCDITARYQNPDSDKSDYLYSAVYQEGEDRPTRVEGLPREAFIFIDKAFTTDLHLQNSFRHEARIPDDMLPNHWRNMKNDSNQS